MSHRQICPISAVASHRPSRLNWKAESQPRPGPRRTIDLPLWPVDLRSHKRTASRSWRPPLTSQRPSGLNATILTAPSCPRKIVGVAARSCKSHRRTVLSSPPLANHLASGLMLPARTVPRCPRRTIAAAMGPTALRSHSRIASSAPPVASHRPSALNTNPDIGTPWCDNEIPPITERLSYKACSATGSQKQSASSDVLNSLDC